MDSAAPTKLYSDDVSLLVAILDVNPFFWASANLNGGSLPFSKFLSHLLPFLNSILLLNQLNQVVVIASGVDTCGYIYDSGSPDGGCRRGPALFADVVSKLEEFLDSDRALGEEEEEERTAGTVSSLLSGALSLALCCIQHPRAIALL